MLNSIRNNSRHQRVLIGDGNSNNACLLIYKANYRVLNSITSIIDRLRQFELVRLSASTCRATFIVVLLLEFAYDSLCLRVFELANECAALKATHPATIDYRGDLDYWKRHYGMRACRFVEILERLMQGNHHPKRKKMN